MTRRSITAWLMAHAIAASKELSSQSSRYSFSPLILARLELKTLTPDAFDFVGRNDSPIAKLDCP